MLFTKEQIQEAVGDAIHVKTDSWKHGTEEHYVFLHGGKHYYFVLLATLYDGIEWDDSYDCDEVEQVEVTKLEWQSVKPHAI